MLFLVEVEAPDRVIYFLTRKGEFKRGDWCSFRIKEGRMIGKIRLVVPAEGKVLSVRDNSLRKATVEERREFERRRRIEKKAYEVALRRISFRKLPMKLIATSYPLESNRINFYYTAEQRVDFRALVKDLARVFKVRIQMQQIWVRDESKILGGCGICGRRVCCASFLSKKKGKLDSVSLEAARLQNLPLTSSKISGICGRLRCCLNFEYTTYLKLRQNLPSIGEVIEWEGEKVKVVEQNLLKDTVTIETEDGVRKVISGKVLRESKSGK